MTGGEAFVFDPHGLLPLRLNGQLVLAEQLDTGAAARLLELLERHQAHTGSPRAAELLVDWPRAARRFRLVRPKAEVARIEARAEGTADGEAEPVAPAREPDGAEAPR